LGNETNTSTDIFFSPAFLKTMNPTFDDELKTLIALVRFKGYKRDGCVLYAKYDIYKPECTITELVWGFCRNPCFARRLTRELLAIIPDFTEILGKSNQMICQGRLFPTFDTAMAQICKKSNDRPHIVFSTEGTNRFDGTYIDEEANCVVQTYNATDEDGETWHGLIVTPDWAKHVQNVNVSFITSCEDWSDTCIWTHNYSSASIAKRVKGLNDASGLCLFKPLKHPMPLLNLNLRILVSVTYKNANVEFIPLQVFGVISNDFSDWLSDSSLELKLVNNDIAQIDMANMNITCVSN
jgi:hypothetical protein